VPIIPGLADASARLTDLFGEEVTAALSVEADAGVGRRRVRACER
jgi:hypothetical protein